MATIHSHDWKEVNLNASKDYKDKLFTCIECGEKRLILLGGTLVTYDKSKKSLNISLDGLVQVGTLPEKPTKQEKSDYDRKVKYKKDVEAQLKELLK